MQQLPFLDNHSLFIKINRTYRTFLNMISFLSAFCFVYLMFWFIFEVLLFHFLPVVGSALFPVCFYISNQQKRREDSRRSDWLCAHHVIFSVFVSGQIFHLGFIHRSVLDLSNKMTANNKKPAGTSSHFYA